MATLHGEKPQKLTTFCQLTNQQRFQRCFGFYEKACVVEQIDLGVSTILLPSLSGTSEARNRSPNEVPQNATTATEKIEAYGPWIVPRARSTQAAAPYPLQTSLQA